MDSGATCEAASGRGPGERPVSVESGKRVADGVEIGYDLYVPLNGEVQGGALFLHGFALGRSSLGHHARAAASRGVAALAVDLSSFTKGGTFREVWVERSVRSAQLRNVRQAVDHALWLDRWPCVLVGHSAGGAVALEAAVALQEAKKAPAAVILLDAVPFEATHEVAGRFDLGASALVSIRADPSAWNKSGEIAEAIKCIPPGPPGRLVELRLPGARHGDPMGSNWAIKLVGLQSTGIEPFARLLAAHLARALALPGFETPEEAVERLPVEVQARQGDLQGT